DQRPRPQPDRRDPVADQGDWPGEDGHPVDAHPPRGAGDLQPRPDHQRRQAGGRRDAQRAARARARRALPRRRRIERRREGRHPRSSRQPERRDPLRSDRRRGRLARVRDRRRLGGSAQADLPRRGRQPLDAAGAGARGGQPGRRFPQPHNLRRGEVMSPAMVIARREINAYFNSPVAYIVVAAFTIIAGGIFFIFKFFLTQEASLRGFFETMPMLFMFLAPAITMRLIADEKASGTLELLITMPVRDWQVVLGKFLAAMALLATTLALTLVFAITVRALGPVDRGPTIGGYLGLLLMGGAYMAIG